MKRYQNVQMFFANAVQRSGTALLSAQSLIRFWYMVECEVIKRNDFITGMNSLFHRLNPYSSIYMRRFPCYTIPIRLAKYDRILDMGKMQKVMVVQGVLNC